MTDVSTSWEHIVDALLRNHKYFPSVNLFQKWKILISINWAVKYASIDPKNAGPDKPNTFSNVALSRGDTSAVGTAIATYTSITVNTLAKNPVSTTWFALRLPYSSEIKSVTIKVTG